MGTGGMRAHALVPDRPGCPLTNLRGTVMGDWSCLQPPPPPQSPPVIISNKTLFILQSARIVGELALGPGRWGAGRRGGQVPHLCLMGLSSPSQQERGRWGSPSASSTWSVGNPRSSYSFCSRNSSSLSSFSCEKLPSGLGCGGGSTNLREGRSPGLGALQMPSKTHL